MKKLVLITGMIIGITFLVSSAHAQTTQSPEKATKAQTTQTDQNTSSNFVDNDGDGICDNHQNHGKQVNCTKFVDGNDDGVCDNCKGNGKCGQANCCVKGMQKGNCQGMSKAACCSKGKGHQHRHGKTCTQKSTAPKPDNN